VQQGDIKKLVTGVTTVQTHTHTHTGNRNKKIKKLTTLMFKKLYTIQGNPFPGKFSLMKK